MTSEFTDTMHRLHDFFVELETKVERVNDLEFDGCDPCGGEMDDAPSGTLQGICF